MGHQEHVFGVELDPELPEVDADYSQITQMLFNLLDNAVTYSKEGTKITVRDSRMDNRVKLSVSDPGPGIKNHLSIIIGEHDKNRIIIYREHQSIGISGRIKSESGHIVNLLVPPLHSLLEYYTKPKLLFRVCL